MSFIKELLSGDNKASMQRFGTIIYIAISIFWTLFVASYIILCIIKGESIGWTGAIAMLTNSYLFTGVALGIKAFQKKFETNK